MCAAPSPASESHRVARILIVDDHALARAGLRAMLAAEPDLAVVGEATDGAGALVRCGALAPDLVLMDVRMPGMDGIAATRALTAAFPHVAVVMLTIHEDVGQLGRALRAGAVAYVRKDATQRQLVTAVRQALRAHGRPDPALLRRLAAATDASPLDALTRREVEVLQLITAGRTNREIADDLGIAPGTARGHVERILRKLDATSRTEAATRAVALGFRARDQD